MKTSGVDINLHVKKLLVEHTGGEVFFDALDNSFRESPQILLDFLHFVIDRADTTNCVCIMSGQFGRVLNNFISNSGYDKLFPSRIVVNGGLRHGNAIESLDWYCAMTHAHCIFLDDSFYLGRTRDAVQHEVERCGGVLQRTFVCYDGSHQRDNTVISMYRYYDSH